MEDLGSIIKGVIGLMILTLIGGLIFLSIQYWWVLLLLAAAIFGIVTYKRQRTRQKNMV